MHSDLIAFSFNRQCGSFDDNAFPVPSPLTEPSAQSGNSMPSTSRAGPSFAKVKIVLNLFFQKNSNSVLQNVKQLPSTSFNVRC